MDLGGLKMKFKFKLLISIFSLILLLVGCGTTEMQFSDIVKGDIEKITLRHAGSGTLYSTTDKELINEFLGVLTPAKYSETEAFGISGASAIRLYNEANEEMASLSITNKGVETNNKSFKTNVDVDKQLHDFYKKLLTEKNEVKE